MIEESRYGGFNRRRFDRIGGRFVISYADISSEPAGPSDISQTKDISQGGTLFTTSQAFAPSTILGLKLRLPFLMKAVDLRGEVIESKEIGRNFMYETRVRFIHIDAVKKTAIQEAMKLMKT